MSLNPNNNCAMEKETLIQIDALSRHYADNVAVDNVSFQVQRGEILGFLGPNGAGKSTTMQMLSGVLSPTTGRIQINGIDIHDAPQQAKQHIGFLPEQPPVYSDLTVDEYLYYCARLRHIPKAKLIDAVAEQVRRHSGNDQLVGDSAKRHDEDAKHHYQRLVF